MYLQRARGKHGEHFARQQCEQREFVFDAGWQLGHTHQAVGGHIHLAFIGDGEPGGAARHGVHQAAHAQQLVLAGGSQTNACAGANLGLQLKVHYANSALENFGCGGHHHDGGLKHTKARCCHVSGEADNHDRQAKHKCDAKGG